jgi:hypothetical protein
MNPENIKKKFSYEERTKRQKLQDALNNFRSKWSKSK